MDINDIFKSCYSLFIFIFKVWKYLFKLYNRNINIIGGLLID